MEVKNGVVRFEHVNFRYPGAEEDVLHDIDFVAESGKTTAIIGSTGCRKSTLVNLIPRLYDVTGGSITLDGKDIRRITMKDLRDEIGFDKLASMVTNPLKGKKIAAYYGCLLLRPGKVMQMDNPENPKILEDFIRAIGATPVVYPLRNECCGGYLTLEDKTVAESRSKKVMDSAADFGADMVITACPLCLYNLQKNSGSTLPVVYFTELLAQALGLQ